MKHFPRPLVVPEKVLKQRKERLHQLLTSCSWGIFIRLVIIIAELVGFFLFGSASLLVDALASLIDVLSSFLLIFFIWLAAKPPDANHPFGHGRVEPLIGLQLGIFMSLVGGGMLIYQGLQLFQPSPPKTIESYVWMIPLCAVILLESCYQIVTYTAKKQHSPALAAEAAHYRIDGLTSLCATIALLIAAYVPEWGHLVDHLGAVAIAFLMIVIGINASRQNIHQLLDRVPDPEFFHRVSLAAKRTSGVLGTEKIRIQLYGPNAHVDIDVEVDPHLSVDAAHSISQKVRLEIQKEWPSVQDVTVHIEPYYPNDH